MTMLGQGRRDNSESYRQARGIDFDEVTIAAAGVGGQQTLYTVIGTRFRVTGLTIHHEGTNNTVVTLLIGGGATKVTIDVPAGTTRQWESLIGRIFEIGDVIAVQSSDVTGGNTFVSGSGVEA